MSLLMCLSIIIYIIYIMPIIWHMLACNSMTMEDLLINNELQLALLVQLLITILIFSVALLRIRKNMICAIVGFIMLLLSIYINILYSRARTNLELDMLNGIVSDTYIRSLTHIYSLCIVLIVLFTIYIGAS